MSNKIHPDYVKMLKLSSDSMPTIEEAEKAIVQAEKTLSRHRKKHNKKYKEESLHSNSYQPGKLSKHLYTKSPKYVKNFRISEAQVEYLEGVLSEAKNLLRIVQTELRDNNPELCELSRTTATVEGMTPMPTPLENFLMLTAGSQLIGSETQPRSGVHRIETAQNLLNLLPTLSLEKRQELEDAFNNVTVDIHGNSTPNT